MTASTAKPRHRAYAQLAPQSADSPPARMEAFTFGDPVPVTSLYDAFYYGCALHHSWYEPPIDIAALAKLYRATSHHGSALQVKRNILARSFIPHPLLSGQAFRSLALDLMLFGNAYLEQSRAVTGRLLGLRPALARYVRRGGEQLERYWWVTNWELETEFEPGSIIHLLEPDISQEVYGVPDYLGALQSIMLNEAATLFRRRYYLNGSHAGFIMYVTDQSQNQEDIDAMREALKQSKGPGNFRNLFLYSPGGKKDGVQLIPVSEVAAKDDFASIKNVSRDDALAGHRVPPQLMGIIPNNTGGFGDIEKAARVFVTNELEPLQAMLLEINDRVGEEVVRFRPYDLNAIPADASRQDPPLV